LAIACAPTCRNVTLQGGGGGCAAIQAEFTPLHDAWEALAPRGSARRLAGATACPGDDGQPQPYALVLPRPFPDAASHPLLLVNLEATQGDASSAVPPLRWRRAFSMAPGGTALVDVDMAAAQRLPAPKAPQVASEAAGVHAEAQPEAAASAVPGSRHCAATLAAALALSLGLGAVLGASLRRPAPCKRAPIAQRDACCSPMAPWREGVPLSGARWRRDGGGRLQRGGEAASADVRHKPSFHGELPEEDGEDAGAGEPTRSEA
jgi:hypothetical protein